MARLSATRALVMTSGPDGSFTTPDDSVLLLDEIGTGNTVIPLIVVYALEAGSSMLPNISSDLDATQVSTLERATDYVVSALASAYFAVQTTVLHYYLRREKDGVESGEIAHVFD